MASKENDFFSDVPKYEGKVYDIPVRSTGEPQTGEQSSLRNILDSYGWVFPAVGLPAAGAYGAMKGYELFQKNFGKDTNLPDEETPPKKSLRDRFIGQPSTPPGPQTSIERQLGDLDINTLPKDQRETVNVLIDAERKRMAKQQEAITAINDASQGKIPVPQNITPTISSGNPIQSIGVAPVSTPEVPTIAQLGQQATGTAPIAPPATTEQIASEAVEGKKKGRPTKEAAAKAMEGMTFRSDLGPGDNWLYNSFGAEGRKAILAKYNNGNPAGSYENSQQILAKMMQEKITPSRAELPRDIAKQRGVPPPETNYGKLGKAAKMGGIAGLALTAEQAAQAKDLSMLRQIIGESLLPLGATPSGVEPGTLGPEQIRAFQEAQKLGSPYRSLSR
jgi:hypothetical protein